MCYWLSERRVGSSGCLFHCCRAATSTDTVSKYSEWNGMDNSGAACWQLMWYQDRIPVWIWLWRHWPEICRKKINRNSVVERLKRWLYCFTRSEEVKNGTAAFARDRLLRPSSVMVSKYRWSHFRSALQHFSWPTNTTRTKWNNYFRNQYICPHDDITQVHSIYRRLQVNILWELRQWWILNGTE